MTRLLDQKLAQRRTEGHLAFMPFLVVGDPDCERFLEAARTLADGGADALELGFPYSDPSADGPVIQAADERALASGITTEGCFQAIERFRKERDVPVSLLVYYNLVLQFGPDRFYARARASGIDAVLVADLPLELAASTFESARRHQVAPVCLASAVTTDARAALLRDAGESYVYAAARVGITGERSDGPASTLGQLVERLRCAGLTRPVLAGFGLSTPAHVRAVGMAGADGAIVGSALVRALADAPTFETGLVQLRGLATELAHAAHQKAKETSECSS